MDRRILLVLCGVVLLGAGLLAVSQADLTGTWVGSTSVPNVGDDRLTLTLKHDAAVYVGTLSDTAGMVVGQAIRSVTFEEGVLAFDITVSNSTDTFPVHVSLKVDGDKMTGSWSTEQGDLGEVSLVRQPR
jgi:hypothetical protein